MLHVQPKQRVGLLAAFLLGILTLSLVVAGCEQGGPTPTPVPTWTARVVQIVVTATFTPTPPPTPTPTATNTPVPSPTATATPIPTATNTPRPRPTRTPAPPPTATTPPPEFVIINGPYGERTPATTTIKGYVYDKNGQPLNGVWLWLKHQGADFEAWTVTGYGADPPGYYSYGLKDYSWNADWGLSIVRGKGSREVISQWASFHTDFKTEISTITTDWQRTY